jgi:hypothetical protein
MRSISAILLLTLLVLHPARAAEPDDAPFPTPGNKKGLQVQMTDDALALGIQHAALNVNLTRLIEPTPRPESLLWTSDGREFAFNPAVVADLDRQIKPLSDRGVVVYLILLPYASGDRDRDALMLHPNYDAKGQDAGPIGMFNVVTPDGQAWLTATSEFLAARYSTADASHGRVWGYIAGNEVNSHWFWANMGRTPAEQVVAAYEQSVRRIHAAVRKSSANARVYLSLEHCWAKRYAGGDEQQCLPGRELLSAFAALARNNGDFDWHLAYHPYPEPLTDCRFWRDRKNSPQSPDAQTVTFRNLEVLLTQLDTPELQWQGKSRRVILSEQGFHCREGRNGERQQAAAYALAYTKVDQLDAIDAFILHRHVDHAQEFGLKLGLWTNRPGSIATPDRKRMMYDVFRAAGTPDQEQAFEFALPVIGVASWDEALADLKKQ